MPGIVHGCEVEVFYNEYAFGSVELSRYITDNMQLSCIGGGKRLVLRCSLTLNRLTSSWLLFKSADQAKRSSTGSQ